AESWAKAWALTASAVSAMQNFTGFMDDLRCVSGRGEDLRAREAYRIRWIGCAKKAASSAPPSAGCIGELFLAVVRVPDSREFDDRQPPVMVQVGLVERKPFERCDLIAREEAGAIRIEPVEDVLCGLERRRRQCGACRRQRRLQ